MMQETAEVAATTSSEYGPLSTLVQTVGWIVSSIIAIGFSWRRGGKWTPYQEDLPKAAERFGGVLTAVTVVLLWSLSNSWSSVPFLRNVAIASALAAVAAFLVYGYLVNVYTFRRDMSTANEEKTIKVVGGFTLTPTAQKKLKAGQDVQSQFKDAAYNPNAIWTPQGRGLAQGSLALFFMLMTFMGTVAMSGTAMVLMISQTPQPKPPVIAETLRDLWLIVLDSAAGRIASAGGPSGGPVQSGGYRITIDATLVGQASAAVAASGAAFPFDFQEGLHKITIRNDHSVTWVCPITLAAANKYYSIQGVNPDSCDAGPTTQTAYDQFVKQQKNVKSDECTYVMFTVMDYGPVILRMNLGGQKTEVSVPANTPPGDGLRGVAVLKGYSLGKKVPLSVVGRFGPNAPYSTSTTIEFGHGKYYELGTEGHVETRNYALTLLPNDESDYRTFKGTFRVPVKSCSEFADGVELVRAAQP